MFGNCGCASTGAWGVMLLFLSMPPISENPGPQLVCCYCTNFCTLCVLFLGFAGVLVGLRRCGCLLSCSLRCSILEVSNEGILPVHCAGVLLLPYLRLLVPLPLRILVVILVVIWVGYCVSLVVIFRFLVHSFCCCCRCCCCFCCCYCYCYCCCCLGGCFHFVFVLWRR